MKGKMFNLFEDFVAHLGGADLLDSLLRDVAPVLTTKGPFVGPKTYPDSDLLIMVKRATELLKVPLGAACFEFGKFAFPHLLASLPPSLRKAATLREFLQSVDGIIHVEVRKIHQEATPPRLDYRDLPDGRAILTYRSPRKLYDVCEGLLAGAASAYGTPVEIKRIIRHEPEGEMCDFFITYLP